MTNFRRQDDSEDWQAAWRQLPMRSAFLSISILVLAATFLYGAANAQHWQLYLIMLVALLVTRNLSIGPIEYLWKFALVMVGIGLSLELLSASLY